MLARFGIGPDAWLGEGGEATVFVLDERRVLRVLHPGGRVEDIEDRQRLVDELCRGVTPGFGLPQVEAVGALDGRCYAVERRIAGRSVLAELGHRTGAVRRRLVVAHLEAAAAIAELHLEPRDYVGDLLGHPPLRAGTWHDYLAAKAGASLRRAGPAFADVDPEELAAAMPPASEVGFVHLDAFAGNMMTDGERITAVLDIGLSSVVGDRRLDPIATAVYLCASPITPSASTEDAHVARSWLRSVGLDPWFEPVQRWLAAYWAFATDDIPLQRWCREVLVPEHVDVTPSP